MQWSQPRVSRVGDPDLLTKRLRLRRPLVRDVPTVFATHSDPAAVAHNPSDQLPDIDAAQALWRRWDDHWNEHNFGYWAVARISDDLVIGFCGLKVMDLNEVRVLNLFYRFDPAAWGRGYATESALAVTGWAQAARPDLEVIARVRPGNRASQHVALNVGLVRAPALDTVGEDGPDLVYRLPARMG